MNLEQWTVGGRGFGAIFVFLLMAGEIYTTFTFLGGSGFAYGKGAPAYYILCYGTLAYVLSYFLLPPIWRYARQHRLYSQADFFVAQVRQPGARRPGGAGRHRGAGSLSRAAVQGARHHRRRSPATARSPRRSRSGSAPSSSRPMSWCPACTARPGLRWSRTC